MKSTVVAATAGAPAELAPVPDGIAHGALEPEIVDDFQAWHRTPPASAKSRAAYELHLTGGSTYLTGPGLAEAGLAVAPGIDHVVADHLSRTRSLAYGMESAIAAIEDQLAWVPRALHGRPILCRSGLVRQLAHAAGVTADALSRDAVEQLFTRQAAVAQGRPAASERLPEAGSFVASLLIARELMHHLDVSAISLAC